MHVKFISHFSELLVLVRLSVCRLSKARSSVKVTSFIKHNTRVKSSLFKASHIIDDAECSGLLYTSLFTKFMFQLRVSDIEFL
jgi:hypothetical protein